MQFLISDTFTASLARLTNEEQKAVKITAIDLQLNAANPGMSFHRLDKARDRNFWSVRVGSDIRLIVHRTDSAIVLCYVDHHDKAYSWAERRKLETHPTTGAAQLVEIRETVQEIVVPQYVQGSLPLSAATAVQPRFLFADIPDSSLLSCGVPTEWIGAVRSVTEDSLFDLVDRLPGEAMEGLLTLAIGGAIPADLGLAFSEVRHSLGDTVAVALAHPDAQRRFRVITGVEELEAALDFPWDKWTTFLHPDQRALVSKDFNGPARVAGSAGTGKTVVAIHRSAHLARQNPDSRVLLATFSDTLASALRTGLRRLVGAQDRLLERIDVGSLDTIAERLYRANIGPMRIVEEHELRGIVLEAGAAIGEHKFGPNFLLSEWEQVVDAWQLDSWESYRDVQRLGRKTRLPEPQRRVLWAICTQVRMELEKLVVITAARMYAVLGAHFQSTGRILYDHIVVDEAQDLTIPQLKFLSILGGGRPNGLFFAGDTAQRIFQQPFSWLALGVDVRGRSRNLRVNYRTSHQIRSQADRLLGPTVTDVDGNEEDRRSTISLFNGPAPEIIECADKHEEAEYVGVWISGLLKDGMKPHEIGLFVRTESLLDRACAAVLSAGQDHSVLDQKLDAAFGKVSIGTMHLAKGLEFRAVAVMACDDEVIPLQERIESAGDEADLKQVYDTERHLLYVACTRARDRLLITGLKPTSEFVGDLG